MSNSTNLPISITIGSVSIRNIISTQKLKQSSLAATEVLEMEYLGMLKNLLNEPEVKHILSKLKK